MRWQHCKLDVPVRIRYELMYGDDRPILADRPDPNTMYGTPRFERAYIWPESDDRHIVTLKYELHEYRTHDYGCFHVLPTLDAAIMFVLAASN